MNRHIVVGFICLVFCAGAFARPANPFLILKQQPDGSVVSVFEHGDENYHYETTSDGYLVLTKRLSCGFYQWPRNSTEARQIDMNAYRRLMEGFQVDSSIRRIERISQTV